MNEIEEVVKYNKLLSCYQNLLTETQKDILVSYFAYNLSLSEIAEQRSISRAAVEDALKKGVQKLDEFEKEVKLLILKEKILSIIQSNKTDKDKIIDIERSLKDGI